MHERTSFVGEYDGGVARTHRYCEVVIPGTVAAMLSGYMGKSDVFDRAIAAFSMDYADQNEKDHAALDRAVRRGKVKAVFEGDL
jgi:hypothetical protein